jgi:ribosome biogenesis GTPase
MASGPTNCTHIDEPGCPIYAAEGDLDPACVEWWRKLAQENAENGGAAAVRRFRLGKAGNRK